jgi:hypothetical protein
MTSSRDFGNVMISLSTRKAMYAKSDSLLSSVSFHFTPGVIHGRVVISSARKRRRNNGKLEPLEALACARNFQ